jgi:hypothetical protein
MQGRTEEIVDLVEQMVRQGTALPGYTMFLAMIYCDLDRTDEARSLLEPHVADGFSSLPHDLFWLPSLYVASYVVSELDWTDAAEPLFEALSPFADQMPYLGPARWCQVRYALARLASTLGRSTEADHLFNQAAHSHSRMGAKWCLALTQLSWGESLTSRAAPPADDQAAKLLREALQTAQEHGYNHIARRATRALEKV